MFIAAGSDFSEGKVRGQEHEREGAEMRTAARMGGGCDVDSKGELVNVTL